MIVAGSVNPEPGKAERRTGPWYKEIMMGTQKGMFRGVHGLGSVRAQDVLKCYMLGPSLAGVDREHAVV